MGLISEHRGQKYISLCLNDGKIRVGFRRFIARCLRIPTSEYMYNQDSVIVAHFLSDNGYEFVNKGV
jgi:hypothetical protein